MKFETIYFGTKVLATILVLVFIVCTIFDLLPDIKYFFLIGGTFLHIIATVIARYYKKGL